MTSQHPNRILCAGQPGDSSDGAARILEAASGAASYNIEVAFPTVRGLHGTAASAPDTEVVCDGGD